MLSMAMKIPAIFSSVECIKASVKKIAFGDNLLRFSVVRKVFYTFLHHKKSSNVLFVEPGDSKALKKKLLRLMDDSSFRFKIAENGFQIAIKKFNATRMVKEYEDTYQRIMRKYNQN
jgi:glycosyltransferase involved in cell wall biosynthesis